MSELGEYMTQSNEPTIEQKNRTIFDFMGCRHSPHKEIDDLEMRSLRYHDDWRQLMPVVERIAALDGGKYNFHISSAGQWACYINRDDVFDSEIASYGGFEPMIINVHKAIYQFITWYNQQTTTNESLSLDLEYRGPNSHCKACEDEANGIKHIKAAKHTCRKRRTNEQ